MKLRLLEGEFQIYVILYNFIVSFFITLYNSQFLLQFHLVHVLIFGKIVGQKFEEYVLKIY